MTDAARAECVQSAEAFSATEGERVFNTRTHDLRMLHTFLETSEVR